MIAYQLDPISVGDASKLKAWLTTAEAHLFTECVTAELNERYCQAINYQCESDASENVEKFNNLAQTKLDEAKELRVFVEQLTKFSRPEYGFHKLKINT